MGNRNTSALDDPLQFGDVAGGNYHETRVDGTVRLVGGATAWRDMIMDVSGRRLNSTVGKVDYDWNNNAIDFASGGSITTEADRVQGNQEINHQYLVGTDITFKPHFHWFQAAPAGVLDATAYEISMRWRLVRNSYGIDLTIPDWTTIVATCGVTNNIFDNTNLNSKEYLGQITRFPDMTFTCSVSDTIQLQLARTDSLGGNLLMFFLDIHGQVDSFGSDEEIAKAV